MIRRIMALHDMHLEHMALSCKVGGGVATGLLKISPDFLSKKNKKADKEIKLKPPNTSKINA